MFLNIRIVGSGNILSLPAIYMVPNAKSAIVFIKLNITERWCGIIRLTLKLILLDSKPRKESLVLTLSSALIVKANTKQIVIFVYSRSINSTENGVQRNLKSFKKSKPTQFAQLWTEANNNYKIPKKLSQNVWKNKLLTDMILENNKNFDISFIQESPLDQLSNNF